MDHRLTTITAQQERAATVAYLRRVQEELRRKAGAADRTHAYQQMLACQWAADCIERGDHLLLVNQKLPENT